MKTLSGYTAPRCDKYQFCAKMTVSIEKESTKALKEEAWGLKSAFSVFVVKLYGFCLEPFKP